MRFFNLKGLEFITFSFISRVFTEKLFDANVTIVDQKTELENDVLLLASVRSVDEEGKLKPV